MTQNIESNITSSNHLYDVIADPLFLTKSILVWESNVEELLTTYVTVAGIANWVAQTSIIPNKFSWTWLFDRKIMKYFWCSAVLIRTNYEFISTMIASKQINIQRFYCNPNNRDKNREDSVKADQYLVYELLRTVN